MSESLPSEVVQSIRGTRAENALGQITGPHTQANGLRSWRLTGFQYVDLSHVTHALKKKFGGSWIRYEPSASGTGGEFVIMAPPKPVRVPLWFQVLFWTVLSFMAYVVVHWVVDHSVLRFYYRMYFDDSTFIARFDAFIDDYILTPPKWFEWLFWLGRRPPYSFDAHE